MKSDKQICGRTARLNGYKAEDKAVLFLEKNGYKILERNFRPPKKNGAGEIDIIALKNNILAFIEVKYRITLEYAAESVTKKIQTRQIKAAEYFLSLYPELLENEIHMDVILISHKNDIQHLENAFFCF